MGSYVTMTDGKMMTMKQGQGTPMTETKTMANGTTVMTDGTVTTKSGETMMLHDGQCVMMNGKIKKMPMKMGMMKDSTKM